MIYLIGGVPRVGKSTLAKLLLARNGIAFVPVDALSFSLSKIYPQLDIRFGEFGAWDDIPDKIFPFLESVIGGITYNISDYTIEGDCFFPKHAKKLIDGGGVRAVFLGASAITLENIRKYAHDDWVGDLPKERQESIPGWIIEKSTMIKTESEKYGIPYFDMAIDREAKLEVAYEFLTQ